jgi:tryptophan synthase alpha chain
MNRVDRAFERLSGENARGLVAYLTAGDPAPDRTVELIEGLEAGGADILELGVPFSDPIADGPVIQRASGRALKAGTTLEKALGMIRDLRRRSELPVIVFSYLNPVLRYGFERFAAEAAEAGADGALLTDLNIEAAGPYIEEMKRHGLVTVFLVSQTTSDERLKKVAAASSGFLYLVSTAGVTGVRDAVSQSALPLIERARKATALPLALGFGLSRREHMETIAPYADAAIVGSAFMRIVEDGQNAPDLAARLRDLAADLKAGLKAPAPATTEASRGFGS